MDEERNLIKFIDDTPIEIVANYLVSTQKANNFVIIDYNGYRFNSLKITEDDLYKTIYHMTKSQYIARYQENNNLKNEFKKR